MTEWDEWRAVIARLDELIERDFGVCPDRVEGCPACDVMTVRDQLAQHAEAVKDPEEEGAPMSRIEARLAELGVTLPEPAKPVAAYVPFVESGGHLYVSGQISLGPDGLVTGLLGKDLDLEAGAAAARLCGLNLLAQAKAAVGDLDRIAQVVRLGGFVACTADFTDQPKVIDGASTLMAEVFGEAGRHARAAVGAPSLPLNAAVEIDGVFRIA